MTRLCERPGCSDAASVSYGFDVERRLVWLEALTPERTRAGALCRHHADTLRVPLGWWLDDRRQHVPTLFRAPGAPADEPVPGTLAPDVAVQEPSLAAPPAPRRRRRKATPPPAAEPSPGDPPVVEPAGEQAAAPAEPVVEDPAGEAAHDREGTAAAAVEPAAEPALVTEGLVATEVVDEVAIEVVDEVVVEVVDERASTEAVRTTEVVDTAGAVGAGEGAEAAVPAPAGASTDAVEVWEDAAPTGAVPVVDRRVAETAGDEASWSPDFAATDGLGVLEASSPLLSRAFKQDGTASAPAPPRRRARAPRGRLTAPARMDLSAALDAPCAPDELFEWVGDLQRYPSWLSIVPRAARLPTGAGEPPAWDVTLRGRIGPLARSKRLRMVRTVHLPHERAVFERREVDGRQHSPWVLSAELEPRGDETHLTMSLHYGGSLWGPVIEHLLMEEIERSRPRLVELVSPPTR